MPKLNHTLTGSPFFEIDDKQHQKGAFDADTNPTSGTLGIYSVSNNGRKSYLIEPTIYSNWTNNNDTPYASYDALIIDLKASFFLTSGLQGRIIVNQNNVSWTLGGIIDSEKEYFIDGVVDMNGISISIPSDGIEIKGYSFDISKLVCDENNYTMFSSLDCGNVLISYLTIETNGTGSKVFDLTSSTGNEAVEINVVNFDNCTSRGSLDGFRQMLESGNGFFGGSPEIELIGNMNGYRMDQSIIRGINNITSFFKSGSGLEFSGRFTCEVNADLNTTGALFDFSDSNFLTKDSFIMSSCFVTRNGNIDTSDTTLYPNIDEKNVNSLWSNNTGIPNTKKYLSSSITTEITTTINSIDTYEVLNGTFTIDANNLSHFDSPLNGQYRLLSGNGTYQIFGDFVIEGNANNVIDLRVTKSIDDGVTFPIQVNHIRRTINSIVGSRDVAFFSINFLSDLKEGDRIRVEVENKTSTNNVTAEIDSFLIVTSV